MCAPLKVHDPAKIRKNREFSHTTVSSVVPQIKVHQVAQSKCPKLGLAGSGSNDSLGFYPFQRMIGAKSPRFLACSALWYAAQISPRS